MIDEQIRKVYHGLAEYYKEISDHNAAFNINNQNFTKCF